MQVSLRVQLSHRIARRQATLLRLPRSFTRPTSIASIPSLIRVRYAPTFEPVLFPASAGKPCRSAAMVSSVSIFAEIGTGCPWSG
jgi:hypothetical protein